MAKTKIARAQWQQLAETHLVAAQAQIAAGCWMEAYHVAGYAVECGLKACILVRLAAEPEIIFGEKKFSENCWSHKLTSLLEQAGLDAVLDAEYKANAAFRTNWDWVKDWTEAARYDPAISQALAEGLVSAIADATNGVKQWIRHRW